MASSQSYSDFERDYDAHLSKVRSFLARPATGTDASPRLAADVTSTCEEALRSARQCIHAMQGLAEIEGDPFKAADAGRKLERDVGPLEEEVRSRKKKGAANAANGGNNGVAGGGIGSVFKRPNNNNDGRGRNDGTNESNDANYLFGNNRTSYNAPPMSIDLESGQDGPSHSLTQSLTEMEQRMQDSEHLLRETQALCAESEQIGAATLETMGRQREQIERSGGLLAQSIENTREAREIMKEMARRALKNKILLYCIIGLLVLANGAMIGHLW
eukprot:CAMPEP_0181103824 /NCGR_PEP_ID=MMETSP1071-20121207/15087_1 /TAXON_ID=35127 /ORGANISM="Thalassiosira sp., Strain NH16" /LENGTH=272 /DNA_ID=CAMNT_0023186955 /DNA_START=86 /DNA_END=901 /DNA_ORIENTATION=-